MAAVNLKLNPEMPRGKQGKQGKQGNLTRHTEQ
jgi:hypothetical protein